MHCGPSDVTRTSLDMYIRSIEPDYINFGFDLSGCVLLSGIA